MHAPIKTQPRPPTSPASIERMIELARKHVSEGGAMAAGVYYRMILKDTSPPKTGAERIAHGEAALWYARWARSKSRLGEALDWYQQALAADPLATDYRIEYIVRALIPMGMFRDARIEAQRATRLDPENPEAWRTLGGIELKLCNVEASIAAYDRQLELAPDDRNAMLDRALPALDTADYDTVKRMCRGAMVGGDRAADAMHCLAMVAYREGRHEDAIELFDAAIEKGCYDPDLAHWNKSLALHSIGRYREGWAEHEYRGKQRTDGAMALLMNRFVAPIWDGKTPPFKPVLLASEVPERVRLHVHQEMGHGDAIAMARYLPILAARGYDVRLEVNDSMVELLTHSMPDVKVMPKAADYPSAFGIPPFDYHIPMLSLPYLMGTSIDTVPWEGPYIKADPALAKKYAGARSMVGLCWSSGIRDDGVWIKEYGRRKSVSFEALRPIWSGGSECVSLQVGPERSDHQERIYDYLPAKPTWQDTAALIANLDLVITVDTSVAHLAGAMGKPVWLMMQRDGASWHWMCHRDGASWNNRSPWYPSVTIFRQKKPHEWGDVIERVTRRLSGWNSGISPNDVFPANQL